MFLFVKHESAYEMRISDWISDVCSSDLRVVELGGEVASPDRHAGMIVEIERDSSVDQRVRVLTQQVVRFRIPSIIVRIGHVEIERVGVANRQIGRASCRESVCKGVEILVVAVY